MNIADKFEMRKAFILNQTTTIDDYKDMNFEAADYTNELAELLENIEYCHEEFELGGQHPIYNMTKVELTRYTQELKNLRAAYPKFEKLEVLL